MHLVYNNQGRRRGCFRASAVGEKILSEKRRAKMQQRYVTPGKFFSCKRMERIMCGCPD